MSWLFLSYKMSAEAATAAGGDDAQARAIARALSRPEAGSHHVFLGENVRLGQEWRERLRTELRACDAVLVLHSARSAQSRWCLAEWELGALLGKPLLPLCIDATPLADELARYQGKRADLAGLSPDAAGAMVCKTVRDAGLAPGIVAGDGSVFELGTELGRALAVLERPGARLIIAGPRGSGKTSLLRVAIEPALKSRGHTPRTWPADAARSAPADVFWTDDLDHHLAGGARPKIRLPDGVRFVATLNAENIHALRGALGTEALVSDDLSGAPNAWRLMEIGYLGARSVEQLALRMAMKAELFVQDDLVRQLRNELTNVGAIPLLRDLMRGLIADAKQRGAKGITREDYDSGGGLARVLADRWATVDPPRRDDARRVLFKLVWKRGLDGVSGRELPGEAFRDAREKAAIEALAAAHLVAVEQDWVKVTHDSIFTSVDDVRSYLEANARVLDERVRG